MKFFKGLVLGVMIGCIVGAGLGVNFSQGRPLASNPFETQLIKMRLTTSWKNVVKYGSSVMGDAIASARTDP
ncbi:MAG: hypothetical protein KUG82_09040 [Pseudomonadales bacterium]|nr:hypothetical protein [Pseudomonadales bacterium]